MVHGGGDLRPIKGMALSHAVATRGNDHLRGLILIEVLGNALISDEDATERFGTAEVLNTVSYEKATKREGGEHCRECQAIPGAYGPDR